MLLFSTTPNHLAWAQVDHNKAVQQFGLVFPEDDFSVQLLNAIEEADEAVYLLENGGLEINEEVAELNSGVINLLQTVQKYAPYENGLLMKAIFHMVTMRPDMRHLLLCNTAFFQHMPQAAKQMALPEALRYPEIQRYGAGGIFHQYASQAIRQACPQYSEKIVSIHLDAYNPSIAAVQRGVAVECSAGFGKLEGLAGLTTCGSIDPSLPLQLVEDGLSVDQTLQVLTTQSGLISLDPQLQSLDVLYTQNIAEHRPAREKLQYQILKQIGSAAAVMNGLQQLVFLSTDVEQQASFIMEVAQKLSPLGADCRKDLQNLSDGLVQVHQFGSAIEIHVLQASTWQIMAELAEKTLS
jgi:acetate kinase